MLPTIRQYDEAYPEMRHAYGYRCSSNPTFPADTSAKAGWVSSGYYGLNQGPMVLMIENFRTGPVQEVVADAITVDRSWAYVVWTGILAELDALLSALRHDEPNSGI